MNRTTWWRSATRDAAAACGRALGLAMARGRAALVYGQAGQSMVEYAIVGALVAIVAMIALQAFGVGVGQVFANMTTKISGLGK
jgi:Flp pilus assembly pilin Flp